ncbi:AGAP006649-PA-like protein [Anopheles sinensis]|uniref:AGAP006649-PA-like protein n=1 Tax=Anopheles sinensis TaxID=74873 RepID=A0A084WMD0_ANOSI|nr:AGAP006649-PA-like protein [Anopheles sinensis]
MDQPKSKADQRRDSRAVSGGGGGTREKPDKPKKDKKDKGKSAAGTGASKQRNKKAKKDVAKPMTRVIIRHLPPTMTEELLREQISVDGQMPKHDEFYFVGPDWSLGVHASSRAYINFTDPEDIFRFTDSFDGYTFVDAKGMEYQAVVEYAPLQKLPKNRSRKKDAKCNTIESDSHFISFKEALEAEEQEALHGRGTQEFSFKLEQENKTTTTPLLEFIAQKKLEKRDERRRKQEEKRKARDEERHTRKTQIAKAIPAAIKEEKEGGDIVVRTVLSRLNPQAQHAPKGAGGSEKKGAGGDGKPKDDKDKKARNRKEKDRPNRGEKKAAEDTRPQGGGTPVDGEKHVGKKQDREKPGKKPNREKDKPKEENRQQNAPRVDASERQKKEKEHGVGGKDELASTSKPNTSVPVDDSSKKEVKKYSERRKETRARAETRFAEQDVKKDNDPARPSPEVAASASNAKIDVKKSILTANVAPFIPKEKTTIILAGPSSTSTNNPAALPSTKTPAAGSGPPASKAVKSISEETTSDHGKSPSPDDSGRPDENVPPKTPNEKISEKVREAREARKIRNKDRPSIEIYQPRKRIVPGAGKSEEDRGRSDSDRPSDNVSTSAAAAGPDDGGAKERRHKLTKKASDRQPTRERKNGRKNSTDVEGSNEVGWWM